MRTRDFAAENIVFNKTSPITGKFRLPMYPFVGPPMDAADDIRIKRLVILKASSALGTVTGQVINTKRIACDVGDQIMVCQTDDDAAKWVRTRGKEWLESVPDVMRLLKHSDKYAQTLDTWLFRHKFLLIMGPSITNANSDQVRFVQTDESHLPTYPRGRLTEFEKRMGARWDRQATHITTAPDEGTEIDDFWLETNQNEHHWMCPKCNELVLPCWTHIANERYNGETVFKWVESQSETETLDSIKAVCPYCAAEFQDTPRDRLSLCEGGDYKPLNPCAPIENAGFQWSYWSAWWNSYRETLAEWLAAMKSAQNGDLKKHEDFVKKRECRRYKAEIPDLLGSKVGSFAVGEGYEVIEDELRVGAFDFQEGKAGEGLHWWFQADTWRKDGSSRRLDYRKLFSWADCRAAQEHFRIKDGDTFIDAGHRDKEVYGKCSIWHWYAMLAGDEETFYHTVKTLDGKTQQIPHPYYTQTRIQSATAGVNNLRHAIPGRGLPPGYCYSRSWSKTNAGFLLLRLKAGLLGHEYGIPHNIDSEYTKQLNSYMETIDLIKKTGRSGRILKKIRESDHSFGTSCTSLIGAMIRGYFPLANLETEKAA